MSYRVSAYYVASLEAFCRAGGFDLFKLALAGPGAGPTQGDRRHYTPSLPLFNQVLNLVYSVKDYLCEDFFNQLVLDLRDLCLEHAKQ